MLKPAILIFKKIVLAVLAAADGKAVAQVNRLDLHGRLIHECIIRVVSRKPAIPFKAQCTNTPRAG